MAHSRLLLLLLLTGMIFTHRPEVHARSQSLQFCRKCVRNALMKRFEMQVLKCSGSNELPSSVRLCTAIQPIEWNNKTFQEKHADVLASLQMLHDGLEQAMKNRTTPSCLVNLRVIVQNYLILVKNNFQSGLVTASPSAVQHCSNETTLNKVVNGSKQLLKGKLEIFAKECPQNNN
ncbi:serine/threonine-protein kinase NIM1 [Sarotherodon galilaeus]